MAKIQARVGAVIEVSGPPRFMRRLRDRLTFPNPEHSKGKALGLSVEDVPRVLRFAEDAGDALVIPRGSARMLMDEARRGGLRIEWDSRVVRNGREGLGEDRLPFRLRPYQRQAVQALIDGVQGSVVLPCGGGKTTIGSAALAMLGQAGLVLVHTTDLAAQWREKLGQALGTPVRLLSGASRQDWSALYPGEVAVGTVQTLAGNAQADAVLGSAGVLLVDECHHVPASQWADVSGRCAARWRWGLTATKERSDGLDVLIDVLIGPELYTQTAHTLIAWGFLRLPRVLAVRTPFEALAEHYDSIAECSRCGKSRKVDRAKLETRGTAFCPRCKRNTIRWVPEEIRKRMRYASARAELTRRPERLAWLANWIERAHEAGRTSLVLVGRKPQGAELLDALRDRCVHSQLVTSATARKARKQHVQLLAEGNLGALVATQLADEGLDVPALDFLLNDMGGKAGGLAKQRVGRTTRLDGRDPPLVLEPVDRSAGTTFERQWRSRRRAYVEEYGRRCLLASDPVEHAEAMRIMEALL